MVKEVHFKDFQGLMHHYRFIEEQLEKSIGKFEGNKPSDVRVIVDALTPKRLFHGQQFGCEILLHHPRMKNTVVVQKFSQDFQQAVRRSCKALEKILRRNSRAKRKIQRRSLSNSMLPLQPQQAM